MKNPAHVQIIRHPKRWWDRQRQVMCSYYCLVDPSDGEFYRNERGNIRTWKRAAAATAFLRRVTNRFSQIAYIATNQETGHVSLINLSQDELDLATNREQFGPHAWRKVNLVTLEDGSGFYSEEYDPDDPELNMPIDQIRDEIDEFEKAQKLANEGMWGEADDE